ncbi:uncharacterized protein fsbp isoform X2 [Parambassis ranga]|uniref:Uncharacterized protein fsbp isoform X2 n=1 Tax=Parambassis ranga TaxID=210632 RepID=A0A6P7IS26_9TELE|nr:uncharacterized protein LOC114438896 isoform X2 [Parambassis ranga]
MRQNVTMPGKCKFQDSWLAKDIYKDWLVKDMHDIHFARCRACCKSIKLQAMGEAALTSHAGGAGHKAAVRKLLEGNLKLMNTAGQKNRVFNRADDTKEQVAICFQRVALDRITGRDWSGPHHSPDTKLTSQNAELQDVTFPAAFFTAPGCAVQDISSFSTDTTTQQQQRALSVEQQQHQMKLLEWKNRMKLLTLEQELVREKRRAVKQKERAFRMKKAYYKAKLKRLGEDILPPSSSSDEEEKTHDPTG